MNILEYVSQQLPYVAPMLLVYLAGVVLSLTQLKRLPKPAAFALVGCGILFLITAVFPFVQGYLLISQYDRQWTNRETALWMGGIAIVRMLFHITAFSLLLAAIFVGRREPQAGSGYSAEAPETSSDSSW